MRLELSLDLRGQALLELDELAFGVPRTVSIPAMTRVHLIHTRTVCG